MFRPIGFPTLTIAPPALADKLRPVLPQWVMGLEEPGLARYLTLAALGSGDADLVACGAGLGLWSWQRAPFDRQRVEILAQALPGVPAGVFAAELLARMQGGPDTDDMSALTASGDMGQILRVLLPRLRDAATGLAWLAPAWEGLLRLGSADLLLAALDACVLPAGLAPLRARLVAETKFLYAPAEDALSALDALDAADPSALFGAWSAYLRAELLLRLGQVQSGREGLAALFAQLPWHTHLGLKLHDLAGPQPLATQEDTARAVILVYSWNKADLTRQTLESLARTDYGQARVLVLDNGSSDCTGEVMAACADLFPQGALRVIRLPVNVGAPAARNWLISQPEAQGAEFAVFLDDDVLLPERWLRRLLGEALAHPEAGATGCRIVSATPPPCLQSADYQLFAPSGRAGTIRDLPEHVNVFDNCAGALDFGLFTYARPAAHVSGCCHALRVDVLRELGGFDIRFSPTQFDDLDRDLRSAAAGRPARYAGDVGVAHVQHSSLARAKGPAAMGQVFGNKIKLEGKHRREDMDAVFRAGLGALWDDLGRKWRALSC
ncbi:MAG: glycosyltransferase [Humidesulfovibrio sp.]|uniref:glycosyltransferase n=1 Tax=Humidesulfovibrio sp. TaxID=2910988 RepID=UPI002734D039|nr:glycosyltransferase [Humidesulfovibrio sp.]MDP2847762.1 glycosyltransferase [Humidesulfovibrio sp.]